MTNAWQPIETAPTNTPVLVCNRLHYRPSWARWANTDVPKMDWWTWRDVDGCVLQPTHWMELPEPPEVG